MKLFIHYNISILIIYAIIELTTQSERELNVTLGETSRTLKKRGPTLKDYARKLEDDKYNIHPKHRRTRTSTPVTMNLIQQLEGESSTRGREYNEVKTEVDSELVNRVENEVKNEVKNEMEDY